MWEYITKLVHITSILRIKRGDRITSILGDQDSCYICGRTGYLEAHHVYKGKNRKNSERYGMKVKLCAECHRGTNGVHGKNGSKLDTRLKQEFQHLFEKQYSREKFMQVIGKNYL